MLHFFKKTKSLLCVLLSLVMLFAVALPVSAEFSTEYKHILADVEDVLTNDEQYELYFLLDETAVAIKGHVGIVFTDKMDGYTPEKYAQVFYDKAFGEGTNGVVLVISEHGDYFYTSGECTKKFGSKSAELLTYCYEGLKAGGFSALAKAYCSYLKEGKNTPIESDYKGVLLDLDDSLTDEEEANILEKMKSTAKKIECNIGIVLTATLNGKSDKQYTDDILDETFGFGSSSIMLMMFNNPTSDKTYGDYISTCGKGTDTYGSKINRIFDAVYDGLDSSGFYLALDKFCRYLETHNTDTSGLYEADDYDTAFLNGTIWVVAIIVFVIALIFSLTATIKEVKTYSVRTPISAIAYLDSRQTKITRSNDIFLREHTTSYTRSSSSGGGHSGGGGHHSSSHHSHGGGGGRHR